MELVCKGFLWQFGPFYGHFMAIWYGLWYFGKYFWYVLPRKLWQPDNREDLLRDGAVGVCPRGARQQTAVRRMSLPGGKKTFMVLLWLKSYNFAKYFRTKILAENC
jgi:hypothetical protein